VLVLALVLDVVDKARRATVACADAVPVGRCHSMRIILMVVVMVKVMSVSVSVRVF
jgi:hypothetical protein